MAKNSVYEWDATDTNNEDVGGTNIKEGCPAGNTNDGLRKVMAQIKSGVQLRAAYNVKAANYTALGADEGQYFRFSTGATLSLTAAATLGSGWTCYVKADGGNVTIDPNSTETINGSATIVVKNGQSAFIICSGTAFYAYHVPEMSSTGGLRIPDTGGLSLTSTDHPFQIGSTSADNLRMDTNEVQALNNGVAATLNLQARGGLTKVGEGLISGGISAVLAPGSTSSEGMCWDETSKYLVLSRSAGAGLLLQKLSSDGSVALFFRLNTNVGSISVTTTNTAYNTTSDELFKKFLGEYSFDQAAAIIKADPVREFNWTKEYGGGHAVGWGAQTSYSVSPDLATPGGWKDPITGDDWEENGSRWIDPVTNEPWKKGAKRTIKLGDDELTIKAIEVRAVYSPWGVDQGKRTPYLWAAVSGLISKVEALEAKIAELEAAA